MSSFGSEQLTQHSLFSVILCFMVYSAWTGTQKLFMFSILPTLTFFWFHRGASLLILKLDLQNRGCPNRHKSKQLPPCILLFMCFHYYFALFVFFFCGESIGIHLSVCRFPVRKVIWLFSLRLQIYKKSMWFLCGTHCDCRDHIPWKRWY